MLQEIGTIQSINPKFTKSEYENTVETEFDIDGNKFWIQLSTNPGLIIEQLDQIYGTSFYEDMIDHIHNNGNINSFYKTLPNKYQKVGSIDMRVNDESGTVKHRQQININPKIEYDKLINDNQDLINQAKRLGFRNINDVMRDGNRNPNLYNFILKNKQLFTKLHNLQSKVNNYQEPKEEITDIKLYIKILNTTFNITKEFISKTDPNIFIINFPSELPDEITLKRNNIYKQYAQKYLTQGYVVKEKNDILYLEKNNINSMNEIKRLQQLAGIITEIKVNKPISTPKEIIQNLIRGKSGYCIDRVMKKYGYGWIKYNTDYNAFYETLNSEQKSSLFKELEKCKKL